MEAVIFWDQRKVLLADTSGRTSQASEISANGVLALLQVARLRAAVSFRGRGSVDDWLMVCGVVDGL